MRQVTANEKYKAVKNGILAESEFVRQMRLAFPQFVSPLNGYKDTIQILKNNNLISEETVKDEYANISDDSVRRGMDIEIAKLGYDPVTCTDADVCSKAKAAAINNIKKDPLYYYNLLAKESSKVDKHDKYTETKRGKLEKDTFNDMKKATLKEAKLMTEGTRALVGYLAGNRLTTAYNHYDGYPENLGVGLETHYNDDDKAKDIAMKGYITYLNPETGEIEQTHKDAPKKITLPQDEEEFAREIAEEIDGMGADFGYIWDDRANRWVTIKNTGIRSMIDQIMEKLGDEYELDETEKAMGRDEMLKESLSNIIAYLKQEKGADNEVIKDFIRTHGKDIAGMSLDQVGDEFEEFYSVNYEYPSDFTEGDDDGYNTDPSLQMHIDDEEWEKENGRGVKEEKADKDHDGDGDVESKEDEYKGVKDKAIKKAIGKDNVKEAVKNIITKVLQEQVINEAATNELARIADEYGDFGGLKSAVIDLQNIVTDIEAYYDKTREKIQKVYNALGDITNEEGLKVGAFIAPSIEAAFNKDLRPAVKRGFTSGLDTPKVKTISRADVDRGYVQQEAPKDTVFTPVNEKKK
jgi:hypothetical protein